MKFKTVAVLLLTTSSAYAVQGGGGQPHAVNAAAMREKKGGNPSPKGGGGGPHAVNAAAMRKKTEGRGMDKIAEQEEEVAKKLRESAGNLHKAQQAIEAKERSGLRGSNKDELTDAVQYDSAGVPIKLVCEDDTKRCEAMKRAFEKAEVEYEVKEFAHYNPNRGHGHSSAGGRGGEGKPHAVDAAAMRAEKRGEESEGNKGKAHVVDAAAMRQHNKSKEAAAGDEEKGDGPPAQANNDKEKLEKEKEIAEKEEKAAADEVAAIKALKNQD